MKIAYLILCHTDPVHTLRLAKKLTYNGKNSVYIHLDKKVNAEEFNKKLTGIPRVKIIKDNVKVFWGGYSAIEATLHLMENAFKDKPFDRYVLLQGLDYPLMSCEQISNFFEKYKEIEFIRACNITKSNDKYFYSKCKYYWYFDNINIIKKIANKLSDKLDLKVRKGYICLDDKKYDIYWGAAQWALTENCIEYILKFSKKNNKFNRYFRHIFPADETYFHTIVFNSNFRLNTMNGGEEKEKKYLVNWRNLHYFEYNKCIKVFGIEDSKFLEKRKELFIRKVNTSYSKELLDMIDGWHKENVLF